MPQHLSARIAKNTFYISAGTLLSRLFGFFRDILLARFFGVGWIAESFFVAFRIPNLLRELIGEGGVDSVAVPILSGFRENRHRAQNQLFSLTFYAAGLVVLIGILGSPLIVSIAAPGFLSDPLKVDLTVQLTRILFCFLFFTVLASSLSTLLYTLKKFFIPSFSPLFLNLVMIGVLLLFKGSLLRAVYLLSLGVVFSGILQCLFHYFFLTKEGFRIQLMGPAVFKTELASKAARLFTPRIGAVSVYQLNVFIDTVLASFSTVVGAGAVAALYYTNRLVQFPLALFSLSLARAILPELSDLKTRDMDEYRRVVFSALENVAFWIIPFAVIFLFFPAPLLEALFMRGSFDRYSVTLTSTALMGYSFGLFFFAANRVLMNSFYSLEDTATPAKIAGISLVINAVLSVLLMFPLKVGGIALASSIASLCTFFLLWKRLRKKIGGGSLRALAASLLKIILCSLVMSAAIDIGFKILPFWPKLIRLFSALSLGFLVFLLSSLVLKIRPCSAAIRWILPRRNGTRKNV